MSPSPQPCCRGPSRRPPPKSQAHRLLIAAALADGVSTLSNVALSQDIQATLRCLEALGADVRQEGDHWRSPAWRAALRRRAAPAGLRGVGLHPALSHPGGPGRPGRRRVHRPRPPDGAAPGALLSTSSGRRASPMSRRTACSPSRDSSPPGCTPCRGTCPPSSSPACSTPCPCWTGTAEIRLTTPLESRGYVDMTLDALEQFGVRAEYDGDRTFRVPGNQTFQPGT